MPRHQSDLDRILTEIKGVAGEVRDSKTAIIEALRNFTEIVKILSQTVVIKEDALSQLVDDVLAKVTALNDKTDSAIALIVKLHDLLGNPGDPLDQAKLEQARDLAGTDVDKLAAAIDANTPPTP